MKIKLIAIWRILWENHFLLVLGRGGYIGVTPKDMDQLRLMQDLGKKLKEIQNKPKEKSDE